MVVSWKNGNQPEGGIWNEEVNGRHRALLLRHLWPHLLALTSKEGGSLGDTERCFVMEMDTYTDLSIGIYDINGFLASWLESGRTLIRLPTVSDSLSFDFNRMYSVNVGGIFSSYRQQGRSHF